MYKISRSIHHLESRVGCTPVVALGFVRDHVKHSQRIEHTYAKVVRTSNSVSDDLGRIRRATHSLQSETSSADKPAHKLSEGSISW
jgi:hypothetical protein